MCVLCHQPQNADPTTGNSLDSEGLGAQNPHGIAVAQRGWHRDDARRSLSDCRLHGCHQRFFHSNRSRRSPPLRSLPQPDASQRRARACAGTAPTAVPAQAKAFLIEPSRAACGACHDDVNFASGVNHPGGFQTDDTQCINCHIPQGELPFDASIMGAHVVPTDTPATYPQNPDTLLPGINLAITSVTNTSAGQTPTVNFTLQDDKGNNIALSKTSDPCSSPWPVPLPTTATPALEATPPARRAM